MSKDIMVQGGCHCGAVRFRLGLASNKVELLDCNCSMCSRTGFLHLIVPHGDFELLTEREALTSYRFGTGAAEHLFCSTCGVKSFYQPRSHPEAWSINFRCLDQDHGLEARIQAFDGKNWEAARAELG
ncbi:GFA family protein [uncultured Sphingorhabdus sp.]|uniref:GFA family protein n=1 Tax=uncultured Sphingorhabdus sp. TaxID=1686106 RepID=UPI00261CD1A9|nr:GFA family protein [uncultured Sphingorhabdus sp.]HMS20264.1 GFA family protein [Sphingorhabdus sp.]